MPAGITNAIVLPPGVSSPSGQEYMRLALFDVDGNPINLVGGAQGPQGDPGPPGPRGDKGEKGDKGDTGVTGSQGPKGDQGTQGLQGLVGPPGPKGDTGAGLKGDTGAPGPQGPKGDKGDKGDTGFTGGTGLQGPKGDKGDKGDPGDSGGVPPAVTTLPSSPVDGQEVYYIVDINNGPIWHLRYRSALSDPTYKWEVLGGAPRTSGPVTVYGATFNTGAWVPKAVSGGPNFTLPRAGIYVFHSYATAVLQSAGPIELHVAPHVNGGAVAGDTTGPAVADAQQNKQAVYVMTGRKNAGASASVDMRLLTGVTSGSVDVYDMFISAMPIRLA